MSHWICTFSFSGLNIFFLGCVRGNYVVRSAVEIKIYIYCQTDMFSGNVKMTTLSRSCPTELGQHLKKSLESEQSLHI